MKYLMGLVAALICLCVLYAEHRKIIRLREGSFITIWKTIGGKCYIMPYRYLGLLYPPNDYIETRNDNVLAIAVEHAPTLTWALLNNGNKPVAFTRTHWPVEYYRFKDYLAFRKKYWVTRKSVWDFVTVDIKEDVIVVNGSRR